MLADLDLIYNAECTRMFQIGDWRWLIDNLGAVDWRLIECPETEGGLCCDKRVSAGTKRIQTLSKPPAVLIDEAIILHNSSFSATTADSFSVGRNEPS